MKSSEKLKWGALALLVTSIWAMAFISMKVAGENFTPAQVMLIRTVIAYICLLAVYPKFHKVESLKQELLYFVGGLCSTTLYTITINSAYKYTEVANVSVIASLSPIFVALFTPLFIKGEKYKKSVFLGFIIATFGTVVIATGGTFRLKVSAVGDTIALMSAMIWGFYSVILKKNNTKYPQFYVTRRMFLYGILAVIPVILYESTHGNPIAWGALKSWPVALNFLFLGLVPYVFCHVCIGLVIKHMGPVWTSKFSYLEPVITMILSFFILSEAITLPKVIGAAFILFGVMVSDEVFKKKKAAVQAES